MKILSVKEPDAFLKANTETLKKRVDALSGLSDQQKAELTRELDEQPAVVVAEVPNTAVYWIAVGALAAVVIIIVAGTFFRSDWADVPEFLKITCATAIGAIAGMVVPTPKAGL